MNQELLALLLVGLAAAAGGGFVVYDHYRQTADSRPVDGVVEGSEVSMDREGTRTLHVAYRYTVDGQQYTGTNVCPGFGDAECYGDPDAVDEQYPEGAEVTVYVDPDHPSESFLMRNEPPAFGAFMVVAGLGFALLVLYGAVRSG